MGEHILTGFTVDAGYLDFLWWGEMGSRRRNEQDSLGCDAELRGRSKKKKIYFFLAALLEAFFAMYVL